MAVYSFWEVLLTYAQLETEPDQQIQSRRVDQPVRQGGLEIKGRVGIKDGGEGVREGNRFGGHEIGRVGEEGPEADVFHMASVYCSHGCWLWVVLVSETRAKRVSKQTKRLKTEKQTRAAIEVRPKGG